MWLGLLPQERGCDNKQRVYKQLHLDEQILMGLSDILKEPIVSIDAGQKTVKTVKMYDLKV